MKRYFVLLGLLAGCGQAAATPPVTTSAAAAQPEPEAPSASAEPDAPEPPVAAPPGELVCRSVDSVDGTNELYLVWDGNEATGVIRTTAQSGMRHEQRVKAERSDGIIVVDEPHESDLASHAAVLQRQGGQLTMRLSKGMSGKWVTCQK